MKKIISYSYTIKENEMIIYVTFPNGLDKSVATISNIEESKCDKLAKEIIEDLGYELEG